MALRTAATMRRRRRAGPPTSRSRCSDGRAAPLVVSPAAMPAPTPSFAEHNGRAAPEKRPAKRLMAKRRGLPQAHFPGSDAAVGEIPRPHLGEDDQPLRGGVLGIA